jgi:hypothetical protein
MEELEEKGAYVLLPATTRRTPACIFQIATIFGLAFRQVPFKRFDFCCVTLSFTNNRLAFTTKVLLRSAVPHLEAVEFVARDLRPRRKGGRGE